MAFSAYRILALILTLLDSCEWILVRRRSIHRRHEHIEQAQVDHQLTAVVIPVIEEKRAQDRRTGCRQQKAFTRDKMPRGRGTVVTEISQVRPGLLGARCERGEKICMARDRRRGLRYRIEIQDIARQELRHDAWQG